MSTSPSAAGTGSLLDAGGVVRVEKGEPTQEELAAVIAVLLSRPGQETADEDATDARAGWRRPESAQGHRTPRSWRAPRAQWV
ncbi:acyl-CoA carboxylase subunit epsilon [Streptomyces sp. NPDC091371]|uniref:acyl-CoA carboxylase subunit epsilon n=1 Tax=Streptomyces sp. NPDC091371 TaxID=3155303 RepID=UPI003449F88C